MRDEDLKARIGRHRRRGFSADEELVPRVTWRYPSVIAEYLTHHAKLEWGEAVVDDERDVVKDALGPASTLSSSKVGFGNDRLVGREVAHIVNGATFRKSMLD
jgi:hypothetical protein